MVTAVPARILKLFVVNVKRFIVAGLAYTIGVGLVTVFMSNVTAAELANNLPSTVAPVPNVID
jgi:hypothetical protein